MRNIVTLGCCIALAIFGSKLSNLTNVDVTPTNTVTAANFPQLSPMYIHDTLPPRVERDTVYKDTLYRDSIIYKTRWKRAKTRVVKDTVSILYIETRGVRKGTPPDSMPTRAYEVHGHVKVDHSSTENRLYTQLDYILCILLCKMLLL